MTGPEHYREAERVLDHAEEEAHKNSAEWYANAMAAAQVHATLAATAATVETAYAVATHGDDGAIRNDWIEATS